MRERIYKTYNFEEFINQCNSSNAKRKEKLDKGLIKPDRIDAVKQDMSRKYLQLAISKYSAGYNLSELIDDLKNAIDFAFQSWNGFWNLKSDKGMVLNQYVLSAYDDMLWMLSLAYLLDVSDDYFKKLIDIIDRDNVKDILFEFIISARIKDREKITKECYDEAYIGVTKIYETLRSVISIPNNNTRQELISKFIDKEWYSNHRSAGSFNNHKSKHKTYYGYWSFETAAVVKILNLDDASFKKSSYYPNDIINNSIDMIMDLQNQQVDWNEFIDIIDALQIASGQTYGKRNLLLLVEKVEMNRIMVNKNGQILIINNIKDLQSLIDTYDSNIRISNYTNS